MRGKWLINVTEEPDMINATLDVGRSLRQTRDPTDPILDTDFSNVPHAQGTSRG